MTEAVVLTLPALASATCGYTAFAAVGLVIDPSVSKLVEVIVGATVTITMGWIAYRTLNRKLDEMSKKTAVIEGHVNSRETKYLGDIAALQQEVNILRGVLSEKQQTAALLAQSVVAAPQLKSEP